LRRSIITALRLDARWYREKKWMQDGIAKKSKIQSANVDPEMKFGGGRGKLKNVFRFL
jgi:hypothetical protein